MKWWKFILILSFFFAFPVWAVEVSFSPAKPVEGDPVLVSVKGKAEKVDGYIFGKRVRFRKLKEGYYGIFGIDIEKKPGRYEFKLFWVDKDGEKKSEKIPVVVGYRYFALQRLTLSKKYDELTKQELRRIRHENSMIRALWKLNTPIKWFGPFDHPLGEKFRGVKGHRFGARRIINGIPRKPHSGADYPAPKGTPVYATNSGKVVLVGKHFFAGNSIYIDHGGGLISMYFHLSKILVKQGQVVKKGQLIGLVGATGRVTGPHLHFGVYWMGARLDPDKVLALPIPER